MKFKQQKGLCGTKLGIVKLIVITEFIGQNKGKQMEK